MAAGGMDGDAKRVIDAAAPCLVVADEPGQDRETCRIG